MRYQIERMRPPDWEKLRTELEMLLMNGELYDANRRGTGRKQLDWLMAHTRQFFRFFDEERTRSPARLIGWANIPEKRNLVRSDIDELVDAWRDFLAKQENASEAAQCP